MAEKAVCPECGSGNVYVLVSGKIVCRTCNYDGRKVNPKEKKS
jgi:uncharacterized Zn finger protein (UPF0148 family)